MQEEKNNHPEKSSILPSEDDTYLTSEALGSIINSEDEDTQFVIESLRQEMELVSLIRNLNLNTIEPISGFCEYKGWPEIQIVGPTIEYYQKLFPKHFDEIEFLKDEVAALKEATVEMEESEISPCKFLDSLPKSRVTAPNLNSVIILIKIDDKKFLFTGDAGIDSFYAIPEYKKLLSDIYWLKVPHHASKNNICCDLIKLMNPVYSFVSGNNYITNAVIECLRENGSEIFITRDKNDHLYFSYVSST